MTRRLDDHRAVELLKLLADYAHDCYDDDPTMSLSAVSQLPVGAIVTDIACSLSDLDFADVILDEENVKRLVQVVWSEHAPILLERYLGIELGVTKPADS